MTYQPSKNCLQDKVILVTGAGDGIGKAVAIDYARHGATLILLGKTVSKLETVYDDIEQLGGKQPAIYPMDLLGATSKHYQTLAQHIDNEFGHFHGILHNAALSGQATIFESIEPKTWYNIMQVNVNAAYELTRACLPLLKRESASIIFTIDEKSLHSWSYQGAYAVSKFAVQGMIKVLASELRRTRVRVNGIDPGKVNTNMRRFAYPGENPKVWPSAEQITTNYIYLMDDQCTMQGEILND